MKNENRRADPGGAEMSEEREHTRMECLSEGREQRMRRRIPEADRFIRAYGKSTQKARISDAKDRDSGK